MAVRHVAPASEPGRRTVLITGATGFVGGSLVDRYANAGWRVVGTTRRALTERFNGGNRMELRSVDPTDPAGLEALLAGLTPDVIHHLAAQSSARLAWDDPAGTVYDNIRCQYALLDAAVRAGSRARIVVYGSGDEYGAVEPDDNPVNEEQPLRPMNPYALSKVVQDLMGLQYATVSGLDIVRVRPFLQIGPRRSDRFAAGSFARQVAEIAAGLRPPRVDVGTIDLVRDFMDVRDAADAYVRVAEVGATGEVYNVCSGEGHSLRRMLDLMIEATGRSISVRQLPELQRRGEPETLVGSPARLLALGGWHRQWSFPESVHATLSYWLQRVTHRNHEDSHD